MVDPEGTASLRWVTMGTTAAVTIPATSGSQLHALRATISAPYQLIEQELSPYKPGAWLRSVHSDSPLPIPPLLQPMVTLALEVSTRSEGAFSPTIEPLMRLWGFRGKDLTQPPQKEEAFALAKSIRADLVLQKDGGKLIVTDSARATCPDGHLLDFGAIAKGLAVDLAYEALPKNAPNMLIDLGGTLRARGHSPRSPKGWTVAIRNPYLPQDVWGTFLLPPNMATSTSANYERFVTIDKLRFGHLLDPRTGYPAEQCAAVTVIAPTALLADALSTTLFVLGPDEGMQWLQRYYPEASAIWFPLDKNKATTQSRGFPQLRRARH